MDGHTLPRRKRVLKSEKFPESILTQHNAPMPRFIRHTNFEFRLTLPEQQHFGAEEQLGERDLTRNTGTSQPPPNTHLDASTFEGICQAR